MLQVCVNASTDTPGKAEWFNIMSSLLSLITLVFLIHVALRGLGE
jgi:hypothetical protein